MEIAGLLRCGWVCGRCNFLGVSTYNSTIGISKISKNRTNASIYFQVRDISIS